MSLQGMLETIPLPDVLALLSATKKTGELRVSGNRGNGRLWLLDGSVVGADVPRAATAVDAVFELLRLTSGSFAFQSGAAAPAPGEPVAVAALVSEAQKRLGEWKAIEAVVPAMACTVALAAELPGQSVTISSGQWEQLVAVASAGDVNGAMRRLGVGEYDACRAVKELADAGLVKVGEAPARAAAPRPTPPAAEDEPTVLPHRSPSRPSSGAAAGQPPAAAANGSGPARRPAPAPAPADRAPAAKPAPEPPAERAPLGAARQPAPPSRPAPAGRRAPVPSAEEADELVQQLASLGRNDAPAPPNGSRAEARTAPAARSAQPVRSGKAETTPAPAPAGRPAAEEAAPDAEPTPADAVSDEPINRGMLLKFLSSVRP